MVPAIGKSRSGSGDRPVSEAASGAGVRAIRGRALAFLAAGIATLALLGIVVFEIEVRSVERNALDDLDVIADLKSNQVRQWLNERSADGRVLMQSTGFIEQVASLDGRNDATARDRTANRLAAMMNAYSYDAVVLLDSEGRTVLSLGHMHDLDEVLRSAIRVAATVDAVHLTGIERSTSGSLHLHFIVPLRLPSGDDRRLVGTILLHVDPARYLFALIQSWPDQSRSGETMLVRADGEAVVYLNALRHLPGAAMTKSDRLDDPELVAAVAARERRPGRLSGKDYRGERVYAAYRPVPGTDWQVIAKRDRTEVLAPAYDVARWVTAVAFVAVALLGLAGLGYGRVHGRLERLQSERRSDELLTRFFSLPFIGMAVTSPSSKHWLRFNDRLCEILGYTREEMARVPWSEMTHPGDLGKNVAEFERVMRGESEGYLMEKRFVRKDGAVVETMIDVKCVRAADGAVDYLVTTVEDITERKARERRLLRLARLYATLSECSQAIAQCGSQVALFDRICRAMVENGGMKLAWIGMLGPDGKSVAPVAWAGTGDSVEYVQGIRVSIDPDDPLGRGPTGSAMRENRLFWTEDFARDPRTAPWHERAAKYGWGASAAMPLSRGGTVVGTLTAYAAEVGGFDEEMRGLLGEMGRDIGLALDNFEREARRLQAEATLRENERQFRSLFESSIDAILLTAPDGRILAANAAACAMLDRTEEEILEGGRHLVVDASDPRLPAALAERQRTGRFHGELTFVRKDGTRFPGEVSTSVFRDRAGELRTSMIIRDVTDRNRAEAQLREQIEELERWNRATLDREVRILEMKREVNAALAAQGRPAAYPEAEGAAP